MNTSSMPDSTEQIIRSRITKWRQDAAQYQGQVEEARRKGLPHDQMLATAHALKACADELDRELKMLGLGALTEGR